MSCNIAKINKSSFNKVYRLLLILEVMKTSKDPIPQTEANFPMEFYSEDIIETMSDYLNSRSLMLKSEAGKNDVVVPIYEDIETKVSKTKMRSWSEHCNMYPLIGKSTDLEQTFHYIVFKEGIEQEYADDYKKRYMSQRKAIYSKLDIIVPKETKKRKKSAQHARNDPIEDIDISKFISDSLTFRDLNKSKPSLKESSNNDNSTLESNLERSEKNAEAIESNIQHIASSHDNNIIIPSTSNREDDITLSDIVDADNNITFKQAINIIEKELVDTDTHTNITFEIDQMLSIFTKLPRKHQLNFFAYIAQILYKQKNIVPTNDLVDKITNMTQVSDSNNNEKIESVEVVIPNTPPLSNSIEESISYPVTPITSPPVVIKKEVEEVPIEIRIKRLENSVITILEPFVIPDSPEEQPKIDEKNEDPIIVDKVEEPIINHQLDNISSNIELSVVQNEQEEEVAKDDIFLDGFNIDDIDFTTPPSSPHKKVADEMVVEKPNIISSTNHSENTNISDSTITTAIPVESNLELARKEFAVKRACQFKTPAPKKPLFQAKSKAPAEITPDLDMLVQPVASFPRLPFKTQESAKTTHSSTSKMISLAKAALSKQSNETKSYKLRGRKVLGYDTHFTRREDDDKQ